MTIQELLKNHTPSLSDKDERLIDHLRFDPEIDSADLARRTCSCGEHVDGFYEYVDHLKAVST